jgi:plasmid replication initiation protein
MDNHTQEIELFNTEDIVVFEPSKMVNVPSPTIHIENKMSLIQKKLWFELVYHAFPKMGTQRKYSITLKRLREVLGWNETTSNDTELKEALRGLNETVVNWNIFGKDDKNTWQCFPLLAGCEIPKNSGMCIFALSPFLEDRFLAMGNEAYVKIDLIISRKFQSKYSLSLYCLALDYLMLDLGYSEKKFTLEELRRYLALKEGEYKLTADMNRWIIRPSEEEINKTSDMNIEIKPFKEWKKITGYKLCMSLKPGRAKEYNEKKNKLKQLISSESATGEVKEHIQNQEAARKQIIQISDENLRTFFAKHTISITTETVQEKLRDIIDSLGKDKLEPYLLFLMQYAEKEFNKGGIQKFPGFFVGLIKDDTQIDNYVFYLDKEKKKEEEQRLRMEALLETKIKSKYENFVNDDFQLYLEKNIETIESRFTELIKSAIQNPDNSMLSAMISKHHKGIIDKNLIFNVPTPLKIMVNTFINKYKAELGYNPVAYEEWRQKYVNEEFLSQIKKELEKEIK